MGQRSKLAAVALVLALLAQPVAVVADCVTMPAMECRSPGAQDMHCPPASQLQAQDKSACCNLQSLPAAPPKDPAATVELTAAAIPVRASNLAAAAIPLHHGWADHDPPGLLDPSQAQALLCVFLI
jgi:hypothetical protein